MAEQIFTIVVADDEDELRQAMCRLIDWEAVGFRLVGSAGNGLDALQLVEQLQPDLLLTDIQMPFITGTALARQVRELQPLIQVAFLSGYDDFEYAQSAIESQVISYLLKPITMAELTEALREIHGRMEESFRALAPAEEGSGDLPMAVASLLLDSFGEQPPEGELCRQLHDCGMFFTEPYEFLVLATSVSGRGRLPLSAAQTVDKVLRKTYSSGSFVSGRRVLSLLVSEDGFAHLGGVLDEVYYVARRVLDGDCTIGVSRRFGELSRCTAACREAVDAGRLADGPGIRNIQQVQNSAGELLQSEQQPAARLDQLLYAGSRRELEDYLKQMLPASSSEMSVMQILVVVQNILRTALGEEALAGLLHSCALSDPLSAGIDRETFRQRVFALCLAGYEGLAERKRDSMSLLVDRTLHIIEQRYMEEDLSLNTVSSELHVSPNYLSANMKRYAGDTFINLLIKKRMEAAQVLINSGGLKIGEVAERCGYGDQHYFSFCFKKYYGVSPARMRRGEEGRA